MNRNGGAPKLLPLTLALTVLVWIIATSGGSRVLVKEWLGEAYDSQAEHFLRGDVGVAERDCFLAITHQKVRRKPEAERHTGFPLIFALFSCR